MSVCAFTQHRKLCARVITCIEQCNKGARVGWSMFLLLVWNSCWLWWPDDLGCFNGPPPGPKLMSDFASNADNQDVDEDEDLQQFLQQPGTRSHKRGTSPFVFVQWDHIGSTDLNLPVGKMDFYVPGWKHVLIICRLNCNSCITTSVVDFGFGVCVYIVSWHASWACSIYACQVCLVLSKCSKHDELVPYTSCENLL